MKIEADKWTSKEDGGRRGAAWQQDNGARTSIMAVGNITFGRNRAGDYGVGGFVTPSGRGRMVFRQDFKTAKEAEACFDKLIETARNDDFSMFNPE